MYLSIAKYNYWDALACYKLGADFLVAAGAFVSARATFLIFSDISHSIEHDSRVRFIVGCLPVATILKNIAHFALSLPVFLPVI